MEAVQFKSEDALNEIESARKIVEQDKVLRTSRVLEGFQKLIQENNCDVTIEMLVPIMGIDVLITDKMLPQEKVKLTVIAK